MALFPLGQELQEHGFSSGVDSTKERKTCSSLHLHKRSDTTQISNALAAFPAAPPNVVGERHYRIIEREAL